FSRFTEKEEAIYSAEEGKRLRAVSTPGISLELKTDATGLNLGVAVREKARPYFSVEVFSDGVFVGEIKNYPDDLPNGRYPADDFPSGEFERSFSLGDGEKHIRIILPGTVRLEISSIELSGASYLTPVRYEKKMLIYGDSITQGFDALSPSRVYSVRLCDYLNAEGINKAVGGAVYNPALPAAETYDGVDYIIGAYGINDWVLGTDKESFTDNCRRFWEIICQKYPSAKKILITPIWIRIWEDEKAMGNASVLHELIESAVAGLPDITIINGWELVPFDKTLYGDETTHPNNLGFDSYFENLILKLGFNEI
ncbi:MAG: SGNH/GDSL hydrolase family protein, partial [Oscillospiraceae bacterium]|nr:SGNH/GDSL hydrolase family protein [Oscillospiraceae bacterium]